MEHQKDIMKRISKIFTSYMDSDEYFKGKKFKDVHPITDSNMNLVLKVNTQNKDWIVKHGVPWVRKYPHISAPATRTYQAAMFYRSFGSHQDLKLRMPKFLGYNHDKNILALEFIDESKSGMDYYLDSSLEGIPKDIMNQGIDFLSILHKINPPADIDWTNEKLRRLNHAHMFVLPLEDKSLLDLDSVCPGLESLRSVLKKNISLKNKFKKLGDIYLNSHEGVPLHGDMYPGSCLIKDNKLVVIDPEFCFVGPAEFDLGIFMAHHLILGGKTRDIEDQVKIYLKKIKNSHPIDLSLCQKFTGAEIIRRFVGAAQLPIQYSLNRYTDLINKALGLCLES